MAIAPGLKSLARDLCPKAQRITFMIALGSKVLTGNHLEGFCLQDCTGIKGSSPQSMPLGSKDLAPQLFFSVLLSCDGYTQELTEKRESSGWRHGYLRGNSA